MKRLLLLSLFALLAVHFFSSTAFIETTAAAEDHGGDIVYTKPVKAVIFSHKAHAEDIGLQCEWCHDKTFEMEALAIQGDKNFNMDSLCNENYCGTCHNGDVSFSTTVQCARCHIGEKGYDRMVKEGKIKPEQEKEKIDGGVKQDTEKAGPKFDASKARVKKTEEDALAQMVESGYFPEDLTLEDEKGKSSAIFSHKKHITREKMRCTECHPFVFSMKAGNKVEKKRQLTMEQMNKGEYCGTCHNGEKAFGVSAKDSCEKCHPKK
jgi:c(7)-type cytochrome triheme protein